MHDLEAARVLPPGKGSFVAFNLKPKHFPLVIPAKAGTHCDVAETNTAWIPTVAAMTTILSKARNYNFNYRAVPGN